MSLVIRHDAEGEILSWEYKADKNYEPADDEIAVSSVEVDHRNLNTYRVKNDSLIEIDNYQPNPDDDLDEWAETVNQNEPFLRKQVSDDSLAAIDEAIATVNDDSTAAAMREIAHVLTGDDRFDEEK